MIRKLILIIQLLFCSHLTMAAYNQDSVLQTVITEGRQQLKALQERNERNDAAGIKGQNQYILNVDTRALREADPEVELMDRGYIKQRRLVYDQSANMVSRFFVKDSVMLNKLNSQLQVMNDAPGNTIKAYILTVDYVPMYMAHPLAPHTTVDELVQAKSEKISKENKDSSRAATNIAARIVNTITAPYTADLSKKVVFCGFVRCRVFGSTNERNQDIYIYYPNNNIPDETAVSYTKLLTNYLRELRFENGPDFVANYIRSVAKNNKDYASLPAVKDAIMQIDNPDAMTALLRDLTAHAYDQLTAEQRLYALKILSGYDVIPAESMRIILDMLETVPATEANDLLKAMVTTNDKLPKTRTDSITDSKTGVKEAYVRNNIKYGLCLLKCIEKDARDEMIGDDNYKRLINALIDISFKSSDFLKEALQLVDESSPLFATRNVVYTYNSVWKRAEMSMMNMGMYWLASVPAFDVDYSGSCALEATVSDYSDLFSKDKIVKKTVLQPFDPIVFTNRSSLSMMADFGKSRQIIVPAILMKYADDKGTNQTTMDATMAAIDAATLVFGAAELRAGVTGLSRALVILDMINAGVNLTLNASMASEDEPTVRELLDVYNGITGAVALTQISASSLKAVFRVSKAKVVLSKGVIEEFMELIKRHPEALKHFEPNSVVSMEKMLLKIKQDANIEGLVAVERNADNALETIAKSRTANPANIIKPLYKYQKTGKWLEGITDVKLKETIINTISKWDDKLLAQLENVPSKNPRFFAQVERKPVILEHFEEGSKIIANRAPNLKSVELDMYALDKARPIEKAIIKKGTASYEINTTRKSIKIEPNSQKLNVVPETGKIKDAKGRILTTDNKNGEGIMYVIDEADNIYIGGRGGEMSFPHPTLIGGVNPNVKCAGMIKFEDGRILEISNKSGHFKPSNEMLKVAEAIFRRQFPANSFAAKFRVVGF